MYYKRLPFNNKTLLYKYKFGSKNMIYDICYYGVIDNNEYNCKSIIIYYHDLVIPIKIDICIGMYMYGFINYNMYYTYDGFYYKLTLDIHGHLDYKLNKLKYYLINL